jgi:hypothetical protein
MSALHAAVSASLPGSLSTPDREWMNGIGRMKMRVVIDIILRKIAGSKEEIGEGEWWYRSTEPMLGPASRKAAFPPKQRRVTPGGHEAASRGGMQRDNTHRRWHNSHRKVHP